MFPSTTKTCMSQHEVVTVIKLRASRAQTDYPTDHWVKQPKLKNPRGYTDIWAFPKISVPPNHPFVHRVFHDFHHPFWGVKSPYFWFNTHMISSNLGKLSQFQDLNLFRGFWGMLTSLNHHVTGDRWPAGTVAIILAQCLMSYLVGGWTSHLKNISQYGNLHQVGVKIKNIWNHHPVMMLFNLFPQT